MDQNAWLCGTQGGLQGLWRCRGISGRVRMCVLALHDWYARQDEEVNAQGRHEWLLVSPGCLVDSGPVLRPRYLEGSEGKMPTCPFSYFTSLCRSRLWASGSCTQLLYSHFLSCTIYTAMVPKLHSLLAETSRGFQGRRLAVPFQDDALEVLAWMTLPSGF